jgi:hypothetical protein
VAVGGERPHLTVLVPLDTLERRIATATAETNTIPGGKAEPGTTDRGTIEPGSAEPGGTGPGGTNTGSTKPGSTNTGSAGPGGTGPGGTDPDGTGPPGTERASTGPRETGSGERVTRPVRPSAAGPRAADTGWAGPIAGEAARRLACDARISRVITDGPSQPLDVGRRTRTIPPALRTALIVRDRGCTFPGCDRPPPWTDAHHLVAWIDGGPTSLDNLALLCRRHHRAVHEGQWTLTRSPDGSWCAVPPGGPPRAPSRAA